MTVAKHGISTVLPKLRFPEFRSELWNSKPLGEVAPLQRGFDLPSSDLQPGNVPVVYSNGVQSFHNTAIANAPGLMTGRSGTIGKLHFIENGEYWPHNTSLWVTSFKGNVPKFVYFLFDFIGMRRFASGSGVPTLNRNDVHAFVIAVPESPAEQQKIVDCLTSLDEVIAAQGRKVEALKAHKRGLMQQLFPREGETRPRLRFPEFRNAPEWQQKTLGRIANVKASGDLDSSLFSETRSGGFLHPVYSNAVERNGLYGHYSVPQYPRDSVTITARGTLGVAFFRDHEFMGIGRLLVVSDLMDVHPRFLTECWNHLAVISNEVTSIPQLTAVTARATKLPIPCIEEQLRIADCLSSLDTRITSESNQLVALKTHKQGLMQQLFPAQEAAGA